MACTRLSVIKTVTKKQDGEALMSLELTIVMLTASWLAVSSAMLWGVMRVSAAPPSSAQHRAHCGAEAGPGKAGQRATCGNRLSHVRLFSCMSMYALNAKRSTRLPGSTFFPASRAISWLILLQQQPSCDVLCVPACSSLRWRPRTSWLHRCSPSGHGRRSLRRSASYRS